MPTPAAKTYRVTIYAGHAPADGGSFQTSPMEPRYRTVVDVISNEPLAVLRKGMAKTAAVNGLPLPELAPHYDCDSGDVQVIVLNVSMAPRQRKPQGFDAVFSSPLVFKRSDLAKLAEPAKASA